MLTAQQTGNRDALDFLPTARSGTGRDQPALSADNGNPATIHSPPRNSGPAAMASWQSRLAAVAQPTRERD